MTFIGYRFHRPRRLARSAGLLVCGLLLSLAGPVHACQVDRYAAASRYAQCDLKAFGRVYGPTSIDTVEKMLAKCRAKYTATWLKLHAKYPATSPCDGPRFVVNGDGTATDALTGLQWEVKTDDATIHDKDDTYDWNDAYAVFLAGLNGGSFAGRQDWRLPTRAELQTILDGGVTCMTSPCIDETVFGPVPVPPLPLYWSSTTNATSDDFVWVVNFTNGLTGLSPATLSFSVRAVRGGL
jgi:hypothetical protein